MPDMPRATISPGQDLGRRQDLFRRLASVCNERDLGKLNTIALCIFLLAPLSKLEYYVDIATDESPGAYIFTETARNLFCDTAYTGLRTFLAASSRGGNQTQIPVIPSSPRQRPMRAASLSPGTYRTSKKRKTSPWDFDGPSSRTRLRTRKAESTVSQPPAAAVVPGFVPGSPFAPSSPTPSFIQCCHLAVATARSRDNDRCVFTGQPLVQAAHIYPFSATKLAYHAATGTSIHATTQHAAIGRLLMLFGGNMAKTWREACNDKAVSETAQNILCMDPYLHALWGRAQFGLEPLAQRNDADGGAEIDIRFHWLRRGTKLPSDLVDDADDATVAAVGGHPGGPDDPEVEPLDHRPSGVPLQTGHVFTIRAAKAEDLPSLSLLEVQWHLMRLAAMCGAADVDDDDADDDSDDKDSIDNDTDSYAYLNEWVGSDWLTRDADIEPLDLDADTLY